MEEQYQLLLEIISNNQKWKTKVIVVEKQSPKHSRQGNGRYQLLILMDTQGNTIHASLYDSNITAFEDQRFLGKTYTISKAYVKNNTTNYRYSTGSLQWTITGKTRIEELNEDNLDFLQICTDYVQKKENLMAHFKFADILAVAVDMTPKRLIQSKDGNQTWLQDIILLDMNFKTMMLTLWDSFVDRECLLIANIIDKKPVIFATRLKVTALFGLKLSMKVRSTFFINTPFNAVKQMTE
ncbi:replication protein A 70 kDa DNA-binding subunit D-like [Olea europaea var. sylvestris]|uniref:replication protein A 70 kDa DNA-binding subunit D-like n=1 Tax=Olea europaea var. sylvestris TaxID=158386 RepID=UPI000C1D4F3B|nr:replication protein A 70 kDa DNA-binding subunit D-like [Olea europaea var. sylvestris]